MITVDSARGQAMWPQSRRQASSTPGSDNRPVWKAGPENDDRHGEGGKEEREVRGRRENG